MNCGESAVSPYQQALKWLDEHPTTGSACSLAKLILSLWNGDAAFSFRDCISNLDKERTRLAIAMVTHFAEHGEDEELVGVGHQVLKRYPDLWELGMAGSEAQRALRRAWREKERSKS